MSTHANEALINPTESVKAVAPARLSTFARSRRGWSQTDVHGIVLPIHEDTRIAVIEDRIRALGKIRTAAWDFDEAGRDGNLRPDRVRFWCERLSSPRNGSTARAWRERETTRQISGRSGLSLRVVLVEYTDGRDLILVACRSMLGRRSLLAVARSLATGTEGGAYSVEVAARSESEPDTNLESQVCDSYRPLLLALSTEERDPDPRSRTHRFVLDNDVADATDTEAKIVAALGLTLSRYCDADSLVIGMVFSGQDMTDGPEGLSMIPLRIDATTPVDRLLASTVDVMHRFRTCWLRAELRDALAPRGDWLDTVAVLLESPLQPAADSGESEYAARRPDAVPMSIHVSRGCDGALRAAFCHVEHLLSPAQVEAFCRHFAHVYQQISRGAPDAAVATIELIPFPEQLDILHRGDGGPARAASWSTIPEAVAAQAAIRPDAPAVTYGNSTITYAELEQLGERIGSALGAMGVQPGDRVGICLPRSINLVSTLLGVLKAGAAYVPMDPRYPEERLCFTARDAALSLVIVESSFPFVRGPHLVLLEELLSRPSLATGCSETSPTLDDPAYVIYTSGSTGRPKGVVVPHRNVVDLFSATAADFSFEPTDTWTFCHSVAFDFSVWEIWGCLMSGGRLVVVPDLIARAPEEFHRLLAVERVTVLSQTPTAFGQLTAVPAGPATLSLRLVVFGGEPLDASALITWFDACDESAFRMVNMYGITETTVHVTAERMRRQHALSSSRVVGAALAGWSISIRDAEGRVKPLGIPGEIWVGGSGVALGYLNRADLTAQRFVIDPITNGRVYRSGDLGRLLPNGRLEHLGRIDRQVKIRGHRIELDEIREVYLEDPSVLAAAVVVRPYRGDHGDLRLHAYVVPKGSASGTDIRERAARLLPDYMVPATTTCLPALPSTVNGKLDVDALPEPHADSSITRVRSSDVPDKILDVWEDLFGTSVGTDDDFFELGGNSLLATKMSAQLQAAGLSRLPIRQLYRQPTPRGVATYYSGVVDDSAPGASFKGKSTPADVMMDDIAGRT